MSRFIGNKDRTSIFEAAEYWRDECLLKNNSIFSEDQIWTAENTQELVTYYVENLEFGEGNFNQKLEQQLAPASEKAKVLAAEMMWVMLLCPSSITPPIKRRNIETIMRLANREIDSTHRFLSDEVLAGIGSAGPGYNQYRWDELVYCINFTKRFFNESQDKRQTLVSESQELSQWLELVEGNENRQFRHMLLYMLFPDDHERIFGKSDRLTIAAAFSRRKKSELGGLSSRELDDLLSELRAEQVSQNGTDELDWYVSPLREKWKDVSESISDTLDRQSVLQAINEIDQRGVEADERSSTYDLIFEGKRFPPKLVYSLAHKYKDGRELDRAMFEGGEGTTCFNHLKALGFFIERKDFIPKLLKKFIAQSDAQESQRISEYQVEFCNLSMNAGFGQGGYARVPWISFLGYSQTTSNGIYPVYLYYKSINLLILAYGVSETYAPQRSWDLPDSIETIREYLAREFDYVPEKYGESYIHSAYKLPLDYSDPEITLNLDALIDEYHTLMEEAQAAEPQPIAPTLISPDEEPIMEPKLIATAFSEALANSHVRFGDRHEVVVTSFVSSLMTKPLVILTGLSGSGKTQIAVRFGEWLGAGRMLVAPVRPDWTGAEALFGYEDALKPTNAGRVSWSVPETLQFFLKAAAAPRYPHLLVLDEMNLAHVERYFADVLSGMESDQPCLPNLKLEADGCWRVPVGADNKISFPKNVFIVGTVNIDETTYMFSPKVLDRANTFEFRVSDEDLIDDYVKPIECVAGEAGLARGFLEIGSSQNWQIDHPYSEKAELAEQLRHVHRLLSSHGFEFGHRVFYESQRFAAIYADSDENLDTILDLIVIQKLLPRLHGSRRRLEEPLKILASYCFNNTREEAEGFPVSKFEPNDVEVVDAKLPLSFEKLKRMLNSLRANQFVSFTE